MKALQLAVILTAYDKMSRVVKEATEKSQKELKKLKDASMDAFGKGTAQIAAGVAIATPLVFATKKAIDFEDAMADVAKVMGLTVGSGDFLKMGNQAKDLAVYLGKSSTEAAQMMANLAAGGVAKEDMAEVGKLAGEMAVAFGMSADAAGTNFIKIRNALGATIPETKKVTDAINFLSDNMASEAGEIVNYMASGGSSVAAAFKISGQASAAFGSTLISVGKSSSEAATIMERFAKGVFNNADMKAIFDSAGGGAKGFLAVLEAGKKSQDPFAFFQKFGQYGTDISMMASNFGMLKEAVDSVADATKYADSVNKEFANRQSTTKGQIDKLKASFDVLLVNLGSVFLPVINKLVSAITRITNYIAKWAEENPRLARTIGVVAAMASGMLILMGAVNPVRGAFIALNVMMMTNPVGLILMGIALIAGVIIANWDKVSAFFVRLWNGIKVVSLAFWNWIKRTAAAAVMWVIQPWLNLGTAFARVWESVKAIFTGVYDWIMSLGDKFYEAGKNIVNSIWEGIKSMAMKPVEAIKDMTDKMREYLPFSPAKRGALRDIHRVKIIETIAQTVKPAPLLKAMSQVAQATFNALPGSQPTPAFAGAGGGGVSINYSPTITFAGGAGDQSNFEQMLRKHSREVIKMIEEAQRRKERVSY